MLARPIVGHERPIELLFRLYREDRLPHALLFAGPPGVGKHLVAESLAATAVCQTGCVAGCGTCSGCRQLAAGSHPDVMGVGVPKGKREIPIEAVRELQQFLQLRPIRSPHKIAIVDDAYLLNTAAQNALLKSLEEPPPGSYVILVSHNCGALLPTVRSRCHRILFGPLPEESLRVVLTERLGISAEEARDLAPLAQGSPGKAIELQAHLSADERAALRACLADLRGARYGAFVPLASRLARSEETASLAMEVLLHALRQEALAHARCGDAEAAARAADDGARVIRTAFLLARRNVNRQLCLESLFLELARR